MRTRKHFLCVHGHFYQPPGRMHSLGSFQKNQALIHSTIGMKRSMRNVTNLMRSRVISAGSVSIWDQRCCSGWSITIRPLITKSSSRKRRISSRNGVGNGMAQAYNHTIMPLASRQDKITQVIWGIADYKHRYGHEPAGMWLPEAAVDMESLRIMADQGNQIHNISSLAGGRSRDRSSKTLPDQAR